MKKITSIPSSGIVIDREVGNLEGLNCEDEKEGSKVVAEKNMCCTTEEKMEKNGKLFK